MTKLSLLSTRGGRATIRKNNNIFPSSITGKAGRPDNIENRGSLNLVHNEIKRKLDNQIDNIRAVDSKIGSIIGFTLVAFSVLALRNTSSLAGTIILKKGILSVNISLLFLYRISIFLIILSLATGLLSFFFRAFASDPDPKMLFNKYLNIKEDVTKEQIVANYAEAYQKNQVTLNRKVLIGKITFISLFLGMFLIFIISI